MTDINASITSMSNATEIYQAENNTRQTGQAELGQDAFLKLLMTQLKYQDPMSPMGNQEFIAQQAQFTQISELQKLNKTMSSSNQLMQASSLIGKTVTLTNPDNPDSTVEGKVTEAKITKDGATIVLDGEKDYPLNSIISIKNNQEV